MKKITIAKLVTQTFFSLLIVRGYNKSVNLAVINFNKIELKITKNKLIPILSNVSIK